MIEVAQGSAIRLRQEIRDKRQLFGKDAVAREKAAVDQAAAAFSGNSTKADLLNMHNSIVVMQQRRTMVHNRAASVAPGLLQPGGGNMQS